MSYTSLERWWRTSGWDPREGPFPFFWEILISKVVDCGLRVTNIHVCFIDSREFVIIRSCLMSTAYETFCFSQIFALYSVCLLWYTYIIIKSIIDFMMKLFLIIVYYNKTWLCSILIFCSRLNEYRQWPYLLKRYPFHHKICKVFGNVGFLLDIMAVVYSKPSCTFGAH